MRKLSYIWIYELNFDVEKSDLKNAVSRKKSLNFYMLKPTDPEASTPKRIRQGKTTLFTMLQIK